MAKWIKYQDINGFLVRPGVFRVNGAIQREDGICFTINSHGATSCTLLLFHPQESEPYATLPFPESCHLANYIRATVKAYDDGMSWQECREMLLKIRKYLTLVGNSAARHRVYERLYILFFICVVHLYSFPFNNLFIAAEKLNHSASCSSFCALPMSVML